MARKKIPPAKRFTRGDRLPVQAQRIWLILAAFVMHSKRNPKRPETMTYGELAESMGYADPRAGHVLGRQLGIIGYFCKANDLPPLNAIVVSQATGVPGSEVVLRNGRSIRQEQADVMKTDWFSLRVPSPGTFRRVLEAMW